MRIVFLGTGDIALPTLRALIADPHHAVVGVVTQPDKPVGRKQVITPPEIKTLALSHGIPVEQPERIRKKAALATIAAWNPEVIVVMAYGQILPKALLDMPSVACLNLHASLLPRHRGAAPVQAAIRDGDAQSGITVMHIAEGLDTGDMVLQHAFDLAPDETGQSLHDRLAACAPKALSEALELLESGNAPRTIQDERHMTHTGKLTRDDGILDWSKPAGELERLIRAYHPWPGTLAFFEENGTKRRLKVFPPVSVMAPKDPNAQPGTTHLNEDGTWCVMTGTSHLCDSIRRQASHVCLAVLSGLPDFASDQAFVVSTASNV